MKYKVDKFLETGVAYCKHHGKHSEWKFIPRKGKLRNGKIFNYRALECRKCVRERTANYYKRNPEYQDKYRFSENGTLHFMLNNAKKRAKNKKIGFELDINWVKVQLKIQNHKCEYTGLKFVFGGKKINSKRWLTPSIDQKIAGKGYTKENSKLVCTAINIMKQDIPIKEFKKFCKAFIMKS